jgi:hypothetical protein
MTIGIAGQHPFVDQLLVERRQRDACRSRNQSSTCEMTNRRR